ncbi:MAG: hypothetical protein JNG85_05975 [Spirochaetaceae bacterium]|nr:hypothetical protein [Spirochaetaceae bacterium]
MATRPAAATGGPATGRGRKGRRLAESAYAAALALAVGLSLAGARGLGGLGDAIAETTLRGGGARAVGEVFGSGFAAAIEGFGALKGAGTAEGAPRSFGRFK